MSNIPKPQNTISVHGTLFSHQDIFNVIDEFYTLVQKDELLSVPFKSVHDWPEHIERLTHFWWIRFGGKAYMISDYNPVLKHFFAGFNEVLLKQWLLLFQQTLQSRLTQQQAQVWLNIASHMGEALNIRNEMYRKHYESQS